MELQGVVINKFTREQIDALYPDAYMIMPMKVWTLPKNKKHMKNDILSEGKYIAQLKKDGYYYSYEKHASKSYLFSKSISKKTGLLSEKIANIPHVQEILEKYIPNGTVLIGEICSRKGGSNEVTKIMGCGAEKARMRQEKNPTSKMYFYIHDIAIHLGDSQLNSYTECRLKLLKAMKSRFEKQATKEEKMFVEFAETYTEDLGTLLSDAFADEEEGIVLKLKTGKIVPEKRPAWNTIKFKKELADLDVVCMGYLPPIFKYDGKGIETWQYWMDKDTNEYLKGNWYPQYAGGAHLIAIKKAVYMGWIGSIKVGAYDENGKLQFIGTVSSGITDKLFKAIFDNPYKFIDMPLVIGAMEPGVGENKLRHLYLNSKIGFLGFRDDIAPEDCTLAKIFN